MGTTPANHKQDLSGNEHGRLANVMTGTVIWLSFFLPFVEDSPWFWPKRWSVLISINNLYD